METQVPAPRMYRPWQHGQPMVHDLASLLPDIVANAIMSFEYTVLWFIYCSWGCGPDNTLARVKNPLPVRLYESFHRASPDGAKSLPTPNRPSGPNLTPTHCILQTVTELQTVTDSHRRLQVVTEVPWITLLERPRLLLEAYSGYRTMMMMMNLRCWLLLKRLIMGTIEWGSSSTVSKMAPRYGGALRIPYWDWNL